MHTLLTQSSVVQALVSSQSDGSVQQAAFTVPAQLPAPSQRSVSVHGFPSSQLAPLSGTFVQALLTQSSTVQSSVSSQSEGSVQPHVPLSVFSQRLLTQASSVQPSLSSQSEGSVQHVGIAVPTHTPAPSHRSVSVHTSPSSQPVPVSGTLVQALLTQSSMVHALPSSQSVARVQPQVPLSTFWQTLLTQVSSVQVSVSSH